MYTYKGVTAVSSLCRHLAELQELVETVLVGDINEVRKTSVKYACKIDEKREIIKYCGNDSNMERVRSMCLTFLIA